jgi:hypothetical protein
MLDKLRQDVGPSDATVIVRFKIGIFVVSSCSC